MNLRRRLNQEPLAIQLAPMIDVIMFLLTFFFVTWNLSRYELDLDVKTPTARAGKPARPTAGEVVVNVRTTGEVTLNRRTVDKAELESILSELVKIDPNQIMVLRVDGDAAYKHAMAVIDICRVVGLKNIAFAASREEPGSSSGGSSAPPVAPAP
ncbi:biopolymer transporter ExbD [Verrucomicrobia bacterium LW23]|nr:biopolymer transporter ExbD [Verrucomicrobia bacterium LW23]